MKLFEQAPGVALITCRLVLLYLQGRCHSTPDAQEHRGKEASSSRNKAPSQRLLRPQPHVPGVCSVKCDHAVLVDGVQNHLGKASVITVDAVREESLCVCSGKKTFFGLSFWTDGRKEFQCAGEEKEIRASMNGELQQVICSGVRPVRTNRKPVV